MPRAMQCGNPWPQPRGIMPPGCAPSSEPSANVGIRIRQTIVDIQLKSPSIRVIVPIAAKVAHVASIAIAVISQGQPRRKAANQAKPTGRQLMQGTKLGF